MVYKIDLLMCILCTYLIYLVLFRVLAGTTLTACVAYYIFPYGWSFDLCMVNSIVVFKLSIPDTPPSWLNLSFCPFLIKGIWKYPFCN